MKTYRYQTGELYCQQPLSVSDWGSHHLHRVRKVLAGLNSDRRARAFIEDCSAKTEILRIQGNIRDEFHDLTFPKLFERFA